MKFYAHSGRDPKFSDWQSLSTHLRNVSRLSSLFLKNAIEDELLAEEGIVAGLLHDLGKYRPEFQQMLLGLNPPRSKTYHKQAGAARASMLANFPVSFAVAGHHGGIPNKTCLETAILSENGSTVATQVWSIACEDTPELATLMSTSWRPKDVLHADLITRLIFSCLIDADWSDTGRHDRETKGLPSEPLAARFEGEKWLARLRLTLDNKSKSCRESYVQRARADVLHACLEAAEQCPNVFSLTVPTGGGKTLAALAFALKHAIAHGLRRVIYVAPFLTILEQNEQAIRSALELPENAPEIFVHHSLAEPPGDENSESAKRIATARSAENWDAPLIITTSVQFFESLFSNKPGQCRKLHNIARSVVILDECQTLPPKFVAPTCGMLRQISEEFKTTIVLCTATQPAFDHDELKPYERLAAREIIPHELGLFERLKRVSIHWPNAADAAIDWQELAAQMAHGEGRDEQSIISAQALCIVNSRRSAREVFDELKRLVSESAFHLSTSMCPAHRTTTLNEVRRRLREKLPCFLVSTQLIESGVDVDFPVVYRELGPLESIIQAAGRCNREGALRDASGRIEGRVIVFRSQRSTHEPQKYFPPDEWYKAGRTTLENHFLNKGRLPQIDQPADIREYFTRLYHSGNLDQHHIQDDRRSFKFADVAAKYQLIEPNSIAAIVATWEPQRAEIDRLLEKLRRDPSRANFRALAPYQVNLRLYELRTVGGSIVPVSDQIELPVWYGRYDDDLGLNTEATDSLLVF